MQFHNILISVYDAAVKVLRTKGQPACQKLTFYTPVLFQ